MKPYRCPICNGTGIVPGGFYLSVNRYCSTTQTTEMCRQCQGSGIIWGVEDYNHLLEQVLYDIQHVPTLTQPNNPLTIEELHEMVREPVYDYLGQEWYVIQEYYDHELLMTDGTSFEDRDELNRVDERFYRRPPENCGAKMEDVGA